MDYTNADDAGVYRISEELAAVLTADFFTPVVDDPYMFGAIAAANSLSDVYAMGAKPVVALNLAMFPTDPKLFPFWKQVMQGGIDKMSEAGVYIIGGHTVKDTEPKFGYAVMGTIHPDKVLDNSKSMPGDVLILTKPIGTGIVSTGIKSGLSSAEAEAEITRSMAALNRRASELMVETGASTATDITGFGLIGHMHEVLAASRRRAVISAGSVPFFSEAVRLGGQNIAPGGTRANIKTYGPYTRWGDGVPDVQKLLLNDTQTSGGLLIFIQPENAERLRKALLGEGILAARIGEIFSAEPGKPEITVEK